MDEKKIPVESLLSTILIGIYTLVFLGVEIWAVYLAKHAGEITSAGMNLATSAGEKGDYISGYFMFPGSITALLGGMTGLAAIFAAAGLALLALFFMFLLIISCVMLKDRKIKVDAWIKEIVFLILTCVSAFFFQSIWLTIMMGIHVLLAGKVLVSKKSC